MSTISCAFELAALANAALPDLQVVGVHQPQLDNEETQMTGLTDAQGERWVVLAPRETKTVEQLESYGKVLCWLNQAVEQGALAFRTPMPEVFIARSQERYAMVYPDVGGSPLIEDQLHSDSLLAGSLGRSLASLHNLATLPGANSVVSVTEPAVSRERIGTLLENTKDVPIRLSKRWKDAVAESTIWQFQPGFLHGNLTIEAIQSKESVVTAMTGFADACIDDPALDLQCLLPISSDDFIDGVVEHYSRQRNSVDLHLVTRAQLYSEIAVLKWLLQGQAIRNQQIIESAIEMLESLDLALDGMGLVRTQRQVHDIHFTAEDEPLIQLRRQAEEEQTSVTEASSVSSDDAASNGAASDAAASNDASSNNVSSGANQVDKARRTSNGVVDANQAGVAPARAFPHNVTREATGAYHRFTAIDTTALTIALRQLSSDGVKQDQVGAADLADAKAVGASEAGSAAGGSTGANTLDAGTSAAKRNVSADSAESAEFAASFAASQPGFNASAGVYSEESENPLDESISEAETVATQILHKWAEEAEAHAAENPSPRPNPLAKANPPAAFSTSVTFNVDDLPGKEVDSVYSTDSADAAGHPSFPSSLFAPANALAMDLGTGWEFFEAQTTALSDLTADLWEIDDLLQPESATEESTTAPTESLANSATADSAQNETEKAEKAEKTDSSDE